MNCKRKTNRKHCHSERKEQRLGFTKSCEKKILYFKQEPGSTCIFPDGQVGIARNLIVILLSIFKKLKSHYFVKISL